MQLKQFKAKFLDSVLQMLWNQWSALGVSGYSDDKSNLIYDPEALLFLTGFFGRYDQRLFDEVLDWLSVNERFINIQRLKNIQKKENFSSFPVIRAIAEWMHSNKSGLKWKGLIKKQEIIKTEPLFFLAPGQALPVLGEKDPYFASYGYERNPVQPRGLSQSFKPGQVSSLLMQLRALFGINSRSEAITYLICNQKTTIQELADQTYYSWRTIQDTLFEMGASGVIHHPKAKKGRTYHLNPELWLEMLLGLPQKKEINWICWPAYFKSLKIIWTTLNRKGFESWSPIEQVAELKPVTENTIFPLISWAGNQFPLQVPRGNAEEYLEQWKEMIEKILL